MRLMQTYNPSVSYAASSTKARLRMPQALLRCPCTGEPIRSECRPTTPQSAYAASSPYTGKPIWSECRPTTPQSAYAASSPCTGEPIRSECRPTTPQSATLPALPRHAYVCRRHYSGALAQGSLYGVSNTTNTRKGDNTYEFWKCGMGIPRNTP